MDDKIKVHNQLIDSLCLDYLKKEYIIFKH